MSLLAIPGQKPAVLFSNPDNLQKGGKDGAPGATRDRKNVTVRLSEDNGKTWAAKRSVESGMSAYSDLALAKDGTWLIADIKAHASYEENVEKLTRFAVVFHSLDSDPVGPIRSGRTQDIALLGSLNQPLFAWSGGNANVTKAIRGSDLVDLSPSSTGNDG
ncbi:MAG: DUF3048 domain-containing protein, partial [Nitrospira sp.]|nr:DUF3048 domain-containing protein [Nitrospira sp.]